ncbi:MAG: hypothetical protein AAF391_04075 [Bacteroidota bacterium]
MSTLQILIRNLYWWPLPVVDGDFALKYSDPSGLLMLNKESEKTVKFLLKLINDLSIMDKNYGSFMDKLNLHRLLELCHHSIFAFGHTRNVAEMGLETVHQILKKSLLGNTNLDKHITAIHHAMCADWQRRVIEGFNEISSAANDGEKINLLKGQAISMMGSNAQKLDMSLTEHREFLITFHNYLKILLQDPFKSHLLNELSYSVEDKHECRIWLGISKKKVDDELHQEYFNEGSMILSQHYAHVSGDIIKYTEAALTRTTGPRNGRVYPYHKLAYGNVIQICTTANQMNKSVVKKSANVDGGQCQEQLAYTSRGYRKVVSFFGIRGFMQEDKSTQLFAIANKLRRVSGTRSFELASSDIQLVEMTISVRRVGMIHLCDSCRVQVGKRKVIHSRNIFDSGRYILLPRSSGFPPRMA